MQVITTAERSSLKCSLFLATSPCLTG